MGWYEASTIGIVEGYTPPNEGLVMTRRYRQLTQVQRYHIEILLSESLSAREIAKRIGVHHSTVYRELSRNTDSQVAYQVENAEEKCFQRRTTALKFSKYTHWL